MSAPLKVQDPGPGAPVPEGRRRFHEEYRGERPGPGAPALEGRTAAARGGHAQAGRGHAGKGATQPFVVTFAFATAPVVNGACTLDAVLGSEIARRVAPLEAAIRATPLACTDGIAHGSSLLLLGDTGVTRPMSVLQRAEAALERLAPGRLPKGRRRTDRFRAKHLLNRYPMRVCAGGAWLGTGHIEAVRAMLAGVLGIGKRRGAGAGMIAADSLAVEPVDADPATWGLVTTPRDGEFATVRIAPSRPLPLALFRRLGGDPAEAVIAIERVRQPYHDARNPPEPAVVPDP